MTASSSSSSSLPAAVPNAPPGIALITAKGFGAIVDVKRMGQYQACADGITPTADSPCEPGATAVDPDGSTTSSGGAASSLDLTAAVVVCPPAACITTGCSPIMLRRHYFANKGLAGCGINTAAAVGTRFTVDFWVW
jgi:zinc transporter 1/2/3